MKQPQNQKRQRDDVDERSRPDSDSVPLADGPVVPPAKRPRARSENENESERETEREIETETDLEAWESCKFPPEFWDGLPKHFLTHRALEEHTRRTRLLRPPPRPSPPSAELRELIQRPASAALARFARHGGPDLRDLRGYPPPFMGPRPAAKSAGRKSKSTTDPTTSIPASTTTKMEKSSPYDSDFELHLTDYHVYSSNSSQKLDLTELREALAVPRLSLSLSKFSDGAFETFRELNDRAQDDDDVMANVMPTILGPSRTSRPSARNTVFENLEPLTDGSIAPARPDFYDGIDPRTLNRSIRSELGDHIVPSTILDTPMLPNFFLEAKGPDGSPAAATRQARYDGAVGSRAMHTLQNFGREELEYDGKPYTYSSTYYGGALNLYAHHVTAPIVEGGRPGFQMTQLGSFSMTDTRETFIQGATAFRNARDLATRHRERFIRAANSRLTWPGKITRPDGFDAAFGLQYDKIPDDVL